MKYDFDREIDRRGTQSVKWEYVPNEDHSSIDPTEQFFGEERMLPMWVADMDFPAPPAVIEALEARARHGIFGYTTPADSYFQAVEDWMRRRHGWEIDRRWIVTTPGVIPGLKTMVRTFSARGEKVLIQPPVYHPFYHVIDDNERGLATNPLIYENTAYRMDYEDLEEKLSDPLVKMVILCNPHNPIGRVWNKEELIRLGELCLAHDVLVVSDEIHCDLLFKGVAFTPFATLGEAFAQNAIICTAGSKTFNLAGLHHSNIIIPNPDLREGFKKTLERSSTFGNNLFGLAALEAAYSQGEEWLDQLLDYLDENRQYLEDYIAEFIPQIKVVKPEGTYLIWLDCRELGLDKVGLEKFMREEARLYLDEGYIFGPEGEGFERMNIACPRSILVDALARLKGAVERLP
ncbi:MAG: MalY/PatB family protein [Anaerolineales bacterium]|jgi:cystathionine beta-lyase